MAAAYSRPLPDGSLDLSRSLRYLIRAHNIDHDSTATMAELIRARDSTSKELLDQALVDESIAPETCEEILAIYHNSYSTDRDTDLATITKANYAEMIRYCQARGCQVVLGNYPFVDEQVVAVMKQLSDEFQVPNVPTYQTFQELVKTEPKENLFVSDGHCTDRGYGIMGDLLFDHGVGPLLKK